jgi:phytoene desaturase
MKAQIARLEPADVAGYERFLAASARLYALGFEELMSVPFDSFWGMARLLPGLLRAQFHRTVYGLVARYISHPKLRMVFSFHPLLVGGNPMRTTAIYALIAHLERSHGVHFAMGGTGSLVQGLVGLIESQGGTIRCGERVAEVLVRDRRAVGVRLASGAEIAADVVVSNADSAATYRDLVPAAARRRWTDRRLARASYSMSLFVWYFGTDRRYPDVPHHMILLGPRYRELLADIFERKILAEDFSLYLHRPTATDPSLAPEGCDAFYVLSPVAHQGSGVDWQAAAEPYRVAIERYLEQTVLPGLGASLVTSRLLTPRDFADRLSSVNGAAFGLEPRFTQTAWFRPHNRSEDVAGLYLVGAGTHPGAGLPGVVSSARVLDRIVPPPS